MKVRDVLKTTGLITVDKDDNLSFVASKLASSHDSGFVFDNEKYLGVINPYYCFIKTWFPPHTKAESCLTHPPRLFASDYISRAAKMMIESKIHYLPVFENQKFKGIVTARRLIAAGKDLGLFDIAIADLLINKKRIITIDENADLSQALSLFKDTKISKLVVTSKENKLKGVLSYYDLINIFTEPREKRSFSSRSGEKENFKNKKIKNYYKTLVLTLSPNHSVREVADLILTREIGSVVIINSSGIPVSIITSKDLLTLISGQAFKKNNRVKITFKNIDLKDKITIENYFAKISTRLFNKSQHHLIAVVSKSKGNGEYTLTIKLLKESKKNKIIKKSNRDLKLVLKQIKETVGNIVDD